MADRLRIFLSHKAEDKVLAQRIADWLEDIFEDKVEVFSASDPARTIEAGRAWFNEIIGKGQSADCFVLLTTHTFLADPNWFFFEAGGGAFRGVKTIPLCVAPITKGQLPSPVSNIQGVNLTAEELPAFVNDIAEAGSLVAPEVNGNAVIDELLRGIELYLTPNIEEKDLSSTFGDRRGIVVPMPDSTTDGRPNHIVLKPGPEFFLTVSPVGTIPRQTATQLLKLMQPVAHLPHRLFPFFHEAGPGARNEFGAVVYVADPKEEREAFALTQVFKDGDILGIDRETLSHRRQQKMREKSGAPAQFIPSELFEARFEDGLESYLRFARDSLQLPLPLHIAAGVRGTFTFVMAVPREVDPEGFSDSMTEDEIVHPYTLTDYAHTPRQILLPFFERVWDACGVVRPNWFRQKTQ